MKDEEGVCEATSEEEKNNIKESEEKIREGLEALEKSSEKTMSLTDKCLEVVERARPFDDVIKRHLLQSVQSKPKLTLIAEGDMAIEALAHILKKQG